MKIIGIEEEKDTKQINKKRVVIAGSIGVILLIAIIIFIIYCANRPFREMIDKYILMKNVVEDSTNSIDIEQNETSNVYAYDKHICVLSKNKLKNYNSSGKLDGELTVEITTPIVATNGKFLAIAEKDKNKIYLISGSQIIWQKELEGEINKITVNKNGYVAAILSGTTHKSVIQTFDSSGNELFKTYLAKTIAIDIDISLDNQYMAFLEMNTSGTSAQSTIKIVSIQKAKTEDSEPIIFKHQATEGKLLTNIKYQEGNRLVCMYDDEICVIKNDTNDQLINLSEEDMKITFADIKLTNYIYRTIEKNSFLNTQTSIEIINTSSKKTNIYTFDGVAKEICSYNDKIAVNLGSEVHFISTNGWLIKKYISSQEIKKIVICNNFAGIVYRNKIELVNI